MNKIPLCVKCAFRLNAENNPNAIVMSINSKKLEARCGKCDIKIGHSKELNRLIGIYHKRRHEESSRPQKTDSVQTRFSIFRSNKYNGDTLSCFIMTIKYQKYSERTVRDYFYKLVAEEDVEIFDRKKLIGELSEITIKEENKNPP